MEFNMPKEESNQNASDDNLPESKPPLRRTLSEFGQEATIKHLGVDKSGKLINTFGYDLKSPSNQDLGKASSKIKYDFVIFEKNNPQIPHKDRVDQYVARAAKAARK
jgi:hypothetical protein